MTHLPQPQHLPQPPTHGKTMCLAPGHETFVQYFGWDEVNTCAFKLLCTLGKTDSYSQFCLCYVYISILYTVYHRIVGAFWLLVIKFQFVFKTVYIFRFVSVYSYLSILKSTVFSKQEISFNIFCVTHHISPACATFLVELCTTVTGQPIELESCSNPVSMRELLQFRY